MNRILTIKAKHFIGTVFQEHGQCPLEKAASEQYKPLRVTERVNNIVIDGVIWNHEPYTIKMFREDQLLADEMKNSDVVRKIKLTC